MAEQKKRRCRICGVKIRDFARYGVCSHWRCRYAVGRKNNVRSVTNRRGQHDNPRYTAHKLPLVEEYQRRAAAGLPLFERSARKD